MGEKGEEIHIARLPVNLSRYYFLEGGQLLSTAIFLFSRWNPEKKWKDRASVRKYNRLLDCSNVYSSIIWKSSGSKYNISNWWKVIFVIFISFYDLSLFCCERMMRYRYKNCEILKSNWIKVCSYVSISNTISNFRNFRKKLPVIAIVQKLERI